MNFVGFSSWTLMFSASCFENLFVLVGTAVDKIDGTSLLLIEDVTILMHPCFVVDVLVSISDFVGRGDPTFGLFSVDNGFSEGSETDSDPDFASKFWIRIQSGQANQDLDFRRNKSGSDHFLPSILILI